MAIRTIVTLGFSNGTFSSGTRTIPTVGYDIPVPVSAYIRYRPQTAAAQTQYRPRQSPGSAQYRPQNPQLI